MRGAAAPHSSSMSRSTGTASPMRVSRIARSARCFGGPSAATRPLPTTDSEPRILNCKFSSIPAHDAAGPKDGSRVDGNVRQSNLLGGIIFGWGQRRRAMKRRRIGRRRVAGRSLPELSPAVDAARTGETAVERVAGSVVTGPGRPPTSSARPATAVERVAGPVAERPGRPSTPGRRGSVQRGRREAGSPRHTRGCRWSRHGWNPPGSKRLRR